MESLPRKYQFFVAIVVQPAQGVSIVVHRLVKDSRSRYGWIRGKDGSFIHGDALEMLARFRGIGAHVLSGIDECDQNGENDRTGAPFDRKASPAVPPEHDK